VANEGILPAHRFVFLSFLELFGVNAIKVWCISRKILEIPSDPQIPSIARTKNFIRARPANNTQQAQLFDLSDCPMLTLLAHAAKRQHEKGGCQSAPIFELILLVGLFDRR
jgi:hypothetical protein